MFHKTHKEKFRPLLFCSGKYQISQYGKVKSVFAIGKGGGFRLTGTILKTSVNPEGYEKVNLYYFENSKKIGKVWAVHRLVALAWIDNPENKREVNHKDLNKLNNNYTNLEWTTKRENVDHAIKNGAYKVKNSG